MSDIAMCRNPMCCRAKQCGRKLLIPDPDWQTMADFGKDFDGEWTDGTDCHFFWDADKYMRKEFVAERRQALVDAEFKKIATSIAEAIQGGDTHG